MFSKDQRVNGVKCGRFVVVRCEPRQMAPRTADRRAVNESTHVVTVREIGPQGQLSSTTLRLPDKCLVAV